MNKSNNYIVIKDFTIYIGESYIDTYYYMKGTKVKFTNEVCPIGHTSVDCYCYIMTINIDGSYQIENQIKSARYIHNSYLKNLKPEVEYKLNMLLDEHS